jgi:pentatricopeptide repeat protein
MLAGFIYPTWGQYERAVAEGIESVRLNPNFPISYDTLIFGYIALNRLDEAKATYGKAMERGFDSPISRIARYGIVFFAERCGGDGAAGRMCRRASGLAIL